MAASVDSWADAATHTKHGEGALHVDQGSSSSEPPRRRAIGDLITGAEATHWRGLLVCDHIDSAGRLSLHQTCRAAQDMMLGTAEHVAVRLNHNDTNEATLRATQAAMKTRGKLRTSLDLTVINNPDEVAKVLEQLQEGTTWLDGLTMQSYRAPLTASDLSTIATCCPNLRALTANNAVHEMPSLELFAKLQELSLQEQQHATIQYQQRGYSSIGLYLPQLTRLALCSRYSPCTAALRLLLSPTNTSTNLRSLQLDATLDDTLLGLLLQCAPALEELTVHNVELQSDVHAQTCTQWRQLQCSGMQLTSLACLPASQPASSAASQSAASQPAQLSCVISEDDFLLTCDTFSAGGAVAGRGGLMGGAVARAGRAGSTGGAVAARIKDMQFIVSAGVKMIHIQPDRDVHVNDPPAALRLGLSMLAVAGGKQPSINLTGWAMTSSLMLELQRLPHWRSLHWGNVAWLPDGSLYGTLLRLLPETFNCVCFDLAAFNGIGSEQVESICMGAPVNRPPGAPLIIELDGAARGLHAAVHRAMSRGVFPHVVVRVIEDGDFTDDEEME